MTGTFISIVLKANIIGQIFQNLDWKKGDISACVSLRYDVV